MKSILWILAPLALSVVACASQPKKDPTPARTTASAADEKFDLRDVYSMQRAFWMTKKDKVSYDISRFQALVVAPK